MVIVDCFSKFLNLIPLPPHAPTELVIEEFHQQYILQYGPPKTLVSDRDTRFISADWKDFTSHIYDIKLNKTSGRHPEANGLAEEINQIVIQLLRALIVPNQNTWDKEADWKDFTSHIYDIKLNKTSGRHPEANGLAEEINQTVIQLLRALIVPDQNTWDKELFKVEGLYNNPIHSATGVTPNQLQYGWQMHNAKYALLLKAAIATMNKRQHAMIKHANKSRKEHNFKVGDYV